jgi:hypothetical protein
MEGDVEMAMMIQPIPLVQTPEGPAWRISLRIDGAVIKSAASPENCLLSARAARGKPSDDQLETQLLIEMRYQQHLAVQALQDLFESGEFGFLE